MEAEIELATQVFEFLEDDYHFDYHLKSVKESKGISSIITYYKDNTTIKININHQSHYFNLNFIKEKDNSFAITSVVNKLIYQSSSNSEDQFELAKEKIITCL
tara:strand:- start:1180 stop:1488 length:309 start_codon:yes stop_codon:yes gene_type:complete